MPLESTAAVITRFGSPVELWKVAVPDLEPGAVLVQVEAATLCGTDAHRWSGHLKQDSRDDLPFVEGFAPPYVPGHETCGTVVEIRGRAHDVEGRELKPGDRVVSSYSHCGHCYYCEVTRQTSLCHQTLSYGHSSPDRLMGGCAELHRFPAGSSLVSVPAHVTSPVAASASCALRTVMHGMEQLGPVQSHESILVMGCGPLGLYAAAVAIDRGMRTVLMTGTPAPRLAIARAWGVTELLDTADAPEPVDRVRWARAKTRGRGVDIVVNCASAHSLGEALQMSRPGGRVVQMGVSGGKDVAFRPDLLFRGVTLFSTVMAESRHFYQAIEFVATRADRFAFTELISGEYPLDRTGEALRGMAELRESKPLINPTLPNTAATLDRTA